MKPPILLKLLQQISPKTSTRHSNSDVGFTIVEVLIVVLIIGILSAIAGPSWLAFVSRQRTRTVNDGVFRALRSAQSEAKLNKESHRVEFRYVQASNDNDPPRVDVRSPDNVPTGGILDDDPKWESFSANGEIKGEMVALFVGACTTTDTNGVCTAYDIDYADADYPIIFDNLGAVANDNENTWLGGASPKTLPYVVTVSTPDNKLKRCVIVQTLLGSMRIDEGDYNSTNGTGCPVPSS